MRGNQAGRGRCRTAGPLGAMREAHRCRAAGATRDAILKALATVRGGQRVTDPDAESKYQALEKFGRRQQPPTASEAALVLRGS